MLNIEEVKQTIFFALNGLIKSGKFVYIEGKYYYENNYVRMKLTNEANNYLIEKLNKEDLDLENIWKI